MKLYFVVVSLLLLKSTFAQLSDIPDDIREDARLTTVF